jgi:hypothetical protein
LPWQLDYGKAVGDVVEKIEWGLLAPIVWPLKSYIRKKRTQRKQRQQERALNPLREGSIHQLAEAGNKVTENRKDTAV